ncbi:TOBE domain-containing protein [Aneurinibacillus sp. Ricciae_BoGa-3]|uniref:TOBE domain-containing protein n=1 Tax=Aneurinibacillus sp. Ricciae_BoGa-3 TaxID=3022697 RepID=UPI0023427BDD|nr:TOBE domain-containing protein [Aneurinibacillus sp. Ricciae_BoGa-3]WCK54587.1 TOBE domain-containing protein [Aneurinibacillus sp. Ricciae_BoGa-3]
MADQIAIMKEGRCEQFGTPEELYQQPVSEYVAKFMGPANIMIRDGQVKPAWFIRPDDIQLSLDGGAGKDDSQNYTGIVSLRTYQGNRYRYFIDIPGYSEPVEVLHAAKFERGQRVHLLFPNEKCRAF